MATPNRSAILPFDLVSSINPVSHAFYMPP
jgi:hypothetical protein